MKDQPEEIYLIDMDGESYWCKDPDPSPGMRAEDAVKYIRVDFIEKYLKEPK